MRLLPAALALSITACGAASSEKGADRPESNPSDPAFRSYAAKHGIRTLSGAGGDTPEVTADRLRLERISADRPVKLDGVLTEWPPLTPAKVVVKGSDAKIAMKIALQYDDAKLYIGADVGAGAFEAGRDHVSLVLAIPQPGGSYAAYSVDLYAGKPGESEGSIRFGNGAPVPHAKIVEAPNGAGYSLEAAIAWSALPEARGTRVGIRGVGRYSALGTLIATGAGDAQHPAEMPWVPSESELSMIEQLLAPKGLAETAPIADLVADLTGDGMRERVAVFDRYLTICGSSYLGGTGYFFRDLGGELVKLEVRDVTGRGKQDVIVRRRARVGDATREYLEVLSALNDKDEPRVTFAHEIAVLQADRRIDNSVHITRGEIDVSSEHATHWDEFSYKEFISTDVEPILLPWAAVRSELWRWDGSRFAKVREVPQREALPGRNAAGRTAAEQPALAPRPGEPPTPKVARGGDLSARVLETYRNDRGIGANVVPKIDLRVHVAGDPRPERVVLLERDLVVFGPGFRSGTGYAYVTLGEFADSADIKDVSARDLTGDSAADIIVRGERQLKGAGAVVVASEIVVVYSIRGETIARVFAIETAREQGTNRIQGLVQFIPGTSGKSLDVLAMPGRATGWTEKTYPWAQDQPGSGDTEPLLLPWGGVARVRYTWKGTRFVQSSD